MKGRRRRGRFRSWLRNLSLRKAYVLYTLAAIVAATIAWMICYSAISVWKEQHLILAYQRLRQAYEIPEGGWMSTQEDEGAVTLVIFDASGAEVQRVELAANQYVGLGAFSFRGAPTEVIVSTSYSDADETLDVALGVLAMLSIPGSYVAAAIACAALFYRAKLREPLRILNAAAERIAAGDLSEPVAWERSDEMGRLCAAFESMRIVLADNNRRMWRSIEERRRLNAAFAHDLRTPLTVMRGYADLLQKYAPDPGCPREKLAETARAVARHALRIEAYADSMSEVQRLEDVACHPEPVNAAELFSQMREALEMLCADDGKLLIFRAEADECALSLDRALAARVWENLARNALRYASNCVRVECRGAGGALLLRVSDDGRLFTPEELRRAPDAYYSTARAEGGQHFGLGLYICRLICEKHGGGLSLGNHPTYGATVSACFGAADAFDALNDVPH